MIVHEDKYRQFLADDRGLQGNTIDTYVGKLNGVSEKIGQPISPELFGGNFARDEFRAVWGRILPKIQSHYSEGTLNDCKSNLKRYWEMLVAKGIR